jgi:SAM-dependent methyltransferase
MVCDMNKPTYQCRGSCRFCGNQKLIKLLDLGASPLCDEYRESMSAWQYYPLALNGCESCGGVQTTAIVNPERIYEDYLYFTKTSPGLELHYQDYAKYVFDNLHLSQQDLIVDIGSNDGCLLQHFQKLACKVVGLEPSSLAADYARRVRGVETIESYLDASSAEQIVNDYGRAKVISFNNVFANIDDLDEAMKAVERILLPDGHLIIETSYLWDMIDNMVFDFIYHEHLSYISLSSLSALLERFEFHITDCIPVHTKGGSMRYIAARKTISEESTSAVRVQQEFESRRMPLNAEFLYFNRKIEEARSKFVEMVNDKIVNGRRIIGYGASATTTTLLHAWKIGNLFDILIDDNPGKQGKFSPGYEIPVLSLESLNLEDTDLIIIIAWRYSEMIMKRLRGFTGEVLVPLPSAYRIS